MIIHCIYCFPIFHLACKVHLIQQILYLLAIFECLCLGWMWNQLVSAVSTVSLSDSTSSNCTTMPFHILLPFLPQATLTSFHCYHGKSAGGTFFAGTACISPPKCEDCPLTSLKCFVLPLIVAIFGAMHRQMASKLSKSLYMHT